MTECRKTKEISCAVIEDDWIGVLLNYVFCLDGYSTKAEVIMEVQPYLPFRNEVVVIDGNAMSRQKNNNRSILHKGSLDEPHIKHRGIKKMRLLTF